MFTFTICHDNLCRQALPANLAQTLGITEAVFGRKPPNVLESASLLAAQALERVKTFAESVEASMGDRTKGRTARVKRAANIRAANRRRGQGRGRTPTDGGQGSGGGRRGLSGFSTSKALQPSPSPPTRQKTKNMQNTQDKLQKKTK